jgi:uncharacterized damage-inducible protein DinB
MRVAEIRVLYDYNNWATDRILRTAAHLTVAQFTAPTRFPWGSLRGTLVHMLSAERFWLDFCQERERRPRLSADVFPDLATLWDQWREDEAELRAWLGTLRDEDLDRSMQHTVPARGMNYHAPLWIFLVHTVNHGTQHRSEAAQMLTESGYSPGDFDLGPFLDERDR